MKIVHLISIAVLLAAISIVSCQNPIDALAESLQNQINTSGQQIQDKAVQHILEGNLTREHIYSDLNATRENLTEQARSKVNQEINESLNLTPEQLKLRAEEELKKRVSQQIPQQPGFDAALAVLAALAAVCLIRRRA